MIIRLVYLYHLVKKDMYYTPYIIKIYYLNAIHFTTYIIDKQYVYITIGGSYIFLSISLHIYLYIVIYTYL